MIKEENLDSLVIYTNSTQTGGIDVGSLRLYCQERSFFIDNSEIVWHSEENNTRIECDLNFEDLEDLFGADTKFDLSTDDLLDDELVAKVWIEYDEDYAGEITSMTLTVNVDGTIRKISCTEE